jgi:peptide chain release factor 1
VVADLLACDVARRPQDRITDHRVPITISGLDDVFEGGETLDMVSRELEIKEEEESLDAILKSIVH